MQASEAQMREQFEKAVFGYYGDRLDKDIQTGNYIDAYVQSRWEFWQECWQSATEQMKPLLEAVKEAVYHWERDACSVFFEDAMNKLSTMFPKMRADDGQALATIEQGGK